MSGEVAQGASARQVLRRTKALIQAARGRWPFWLALIGVPVLIVLSYSFPLGQIYLVEARTLGARIAVSGPDTVWKLPKVTLCTDRATKDIPRAASWAGAGCNPGLFETTDLNGAEIRIPSGVEILMRAEADGAILLRRLDGQTTGAQAPVIRLSDDQLWSPGSLLRISAADWQQVSLLEFAGNIVIGQETGSGANAYLIEGRYEVREHFLRHVRLWDSDRAEPMTVVTGTLYRGDKVSFRAEDPADGTERAVLATGFVAPMLGQGQRGFGVVTSSGLDKTHVQLRIKSFGTRETHITPTWVDRALRDPMLLALTAILGFAVTVLTFVVEIKKLAPGNTTQSR